MSAPLDVLFLIRSLHLGGAERQLTLLVLAMHAAGHRVRVALFYTGGPFEADLRAAGVPVLLLNKRGRWDILSFFWRWVRLVRQERPAVVHGYLPMSNLLAVLAKPLTRWPKVVWGVRSSGSDPAYYGWMGRVEAWLQSKLSRYADLIICNSLRGKQHVLSQGFSSQRTVCVPNGVDCDSFYPDANTGRATRAAWGVPESAYLIGIVGRFVPLKNHSALFQAVAPLLRQHDCCIVCVGSGTADEQQKLQNLAADLGVADKVFFTGNYRDMLGAYNAMDLFVSASLTEGAPNVLGEAMACNIPAVCTDVGDAAWLIADYGQVVPPGDIPALGKAVALAYHNRARSVVHPRARVLSSFSVSALMSNTEAQLYRLSCC